MGNILCPELSSLREGLGEEFSLLGKDFLEDSLLLSHHAWLFTRSLDEKSGDPSASLPGSQISCVTLGESSNLPEPEFPPLHVEVTTCLQIS